MDHKSQERVAMDAMSQGHLAPLLSLMAKDVIWRWMGVAQWSRAFEGKQAIVDTLFGGVTDDMAPSSRVEVAHFTPAATMWS